MLHTIRTVSAVAAGGAMGALARWAMDVAGQRLGWSPWALLVVVNVAGAFALGWFVAGRERTASHPLVVPFMAVGFLGSFTTFSAFTVEAVEGVRAGNGVGAIVFVVGSMALGLAAAIAGRVAAVRP